MMAVSEGGMKTVLRYGGPICQDSLGRCFKDYRYPSSERPQSLSL